MPRPAATGQNCPPVGCSWEDGNPSFSWTVNRNQAGAQLFYFVNRFHDYLRDTPGIAFGPTSGNFEGADRVLAQVDNGAGVSGGFPDCGHANNAAMNVLPDGLPGLMEMYLWSGSCDLGVRDVNGSDDAYIVYHEYTHGLSFRLITDANGVGALNTQAASQSGAMSEGWSDWYAKDYLVTVRVRTGHRRAGRGARRRVREPPDVAQPGVRLPRGRGCAGLSRIAGRRRRRLHLR